MAKVKITLVKSPISCPWRQKRTVEGLGLNGVSWGNDISDGGNQIRVAQWIMLYPSIMLIITVLAFIMLGEAVRNALDPKMR